MEPGADAGYARALAALEARGPNRMAPGLQRITALLDALGEPQRAYPAVHVGGTNGKTSTARMVDALLRATGLRTGRFTSPHLETVRERISIDGEPLEEERFAAAWADVADVVALVDARQPEPVTYFELLTAMAFAAFADAPVDVAVVEVGLGGTYDSTNVLRAPVAVLTPVSLDHTEVLGPDVATIATDKAGIVHEGALLVLAAQPPEAAAAALRRAAEVGATVAREGLEFGVTRRDVAVGGQLVAVQGLHAAYDDVLLPLHGAHQAQNAAVAVAAAEATVGTALDLDLVREALGGTGSPGRLEVLRRSPTVVVDAAHNPAGVATTVAAVEDSFGSPRVVAVFGALADKDARGMLEALEPSVDVLVVTRSGSERAVDPDALGALAVDVLGPDRVEVEPVLVDALDRALGHADDEPGSMVLVLGSVTVAGEARALLARGR